ncbi:MAG: hypothetical protein Q8O79_01015 [Pseudomonadota bacterium]|nr:hypothetical protein [Pseudomonadota bacterium]
MESTKNSTEEASELFSARELAALKLPGYPETERGWLGLVGRERWECRAVKGKGGRGGVRREYQPPAQVMALIEQRRKGEIAPGDERGGYRVSDVGRKPYLSVPPAVEISEEEDIDIVPPKIGGAALKYPHCGGFLGLIKIEGRVSLEFDSPGSLAFGKVLLSVAPELLRTDRDAAIALAMRAYSVIALLTAGDEKAIDRHLDNPRLVDALKTISEELNNTKPHDHNPQDASVLCHFSRK